MTDESVDTERTVVKTYVPRYQKEQWREEADGLDMSQSEFVRSMVQAGRSDLALGGEEAVRPEPGSPPSDPGGDGLETRLLDALDSDSYLGWEELVEALSEDFEGRLEEAIDSLRDDGRIEHSPRQGGYALAEGVDE